MACHHERLLPFAISFESFKAYFLPKVLLYVKLKGCLSLNLGRATFLLVERFLLILSMYPGEVVVNVILDECFAIARRFLELFNESLVLSLGLNALEC